MYSLNPVSFSNITVHLQKQKNNGKIRNQSNQHKDIFFTNFA